MSFNLLQQESCLLEEIVGHEEESASWVIKMNLMDRDYRSPLYRAYVNSHVGLLLEPSISSIKKQSVIYRSLFGRHLPQDKEGQILDLGCGYGGFLYFLNSQGYSNVAGIDVSSEQVEQAHKLKISNVEQGDFFHYLQGKSSIFDLIVAIDVMEHLKKEEVLHLLELAFLALKPKGRLICRVCNGSSPFSGHYRYGDFTHEMAFTVSSIRQVLATSGFQKIEVFPVEPVPHGIPSGVRYVLWKGFDLFMRSYMLIETGEFRGLIFTQNLLAVATKPGD